MKLSIIVPCYNEEDNVDIFYDEVTKIFKNKKISYEIIFINDGSRDNTIKRLNDIVNKSDENIKVINFSRNFGKEAAMYAGLKESIGELVSIIDADLQQRPELMLKMIDILEKDDEYDSVAAYQEKRKEGFILTGFKNCFYKLINKMSSVKFVQGASDFRMFRRCVVNAILELSEYNRFSKGIFSYVGFNTYYMPYEVELRRNGKSKWNFSSLFNYAIEGIVGFSTKPLRLSTILGIIISFISLIYFIITLILGIASFNVLVILILLIGGLNLISTGILGEYLSRAYTEVKNRPVYIIKKRYENYKVKK